MERLGRIMMEERIMKKIFAILSVFAAVIGCQKPEMDQISEAGGVKVPLKVTADIVPTKTTMTNEGGVLKSAWKDGDKFYVQFSQYSVYNRQTLEISAQVDGESINFVSADDLNLNVAGQLSQHTMYAEYPKALSSYGNGRKFSMSAVQTQIAPGDLSHIASSNILYALPVNPEWGEENAYAVVDFTFQHALSVLQLDMKGAEPGITISKINLEMLDESGSDFLVITDGTINFQSGGAMKVNAGSNVLTLNLATAAELPVDSYASFYMTISPGHAGQTFKVTATTDMGKTIEVGTMKVPSDGAIPQGAKAYKSFTVQPPVEEEVNWASAIDLSASGTANTYLVTAPNQLYKFKADVKGNGVVPAALTAENVGTTSSIEPKSALLLWYNCLQTSNSWKNENPVEISSVALKDGYIYFKTPETFVNGNAVIAVFAESGVTYSNITVDQNRIIDNATILWSWNIWASEGYDLDEDAITAGDFTIMGRNIGAVVGKAEIDSYNTAAERMYVAASAIGNYYQWGNKNPYPHISDYSGDSAPAKGNKLYVTPTYTPISALQDGKNGNAVMAEQMFGTIDNLRLDVGTYLSEEDYTAANIVACTEYAPYKYMKNSKSNYGYSWTGNIGSSPLKNLWGDATLEDVSDHVKTIYDPCPAGWKVWEDDAWDALVAAGAETAAPCYNALDENDLNKGYGFIINGSYFPTAGQARSTNFDVSGLLLTGSKNISTFYTVSNPNIYASGYWGQKYMINNVFETDADSGNVVNSVTMTVAGNFICVGYATPLRCVKE